MQNHISIIGTSHIAKQSKTKIKKEFDKFNPDIVAVELDTNRYAALKQKKKTTLPISAIRQIGIAGYVFAKIGAWLSGKLGKIVNTTPGLDMIYAIELAKQHNKKIAFIDQNIIITLQRISKSIGIKDYLKIIWDMIAGFFFRERAIKKMGMENLDLSKVPSDELTKRAIGMLKKGYPKIYKVLVAERDYVMVRKLYYLHKTNPDKKIMAVVGIGHKEGMEHMLSKINLKQPSKTTPSRQT